MRPFRDLSIKTKLNLLLALTAGLALLLAGAAFVANEVTTTRRSTVQHLSAVADVLGANAVAAVTFNDPNAAKEVLASLRFEPNVRFACVYDRKGKPFAAYQRDHLSEPFQPPTVQDDGYRFTSDGKLEIVTTLTDPEEAVGTLYIEAGMEHLYARFKWIAGMATIVLVVSLGASMLLSSRLQNVISVPIIGLAEMAKRISGERDYSVRVEKVANDEIGVLCDEFNRMLARIEAGQAQLKKAHDDLEDRVGERTRQLSQTNEELAREIADRKQAEVELEELNKRLIDTSRRVGKAEVATSVLHNVGNVLNSVNVSTSLICEKLRKSGVSDLSKVTQAIEQHLGDLAEYLGQDERGKHLAPFLIALSRQMADDEETILREVQSLVKNVDHIKEIVALQQSHAGLSGLIQEASLAELLDDAIRINVASTDRHGIKIEREFEEFPQVRVDPQKLLQVLVNLISNAKYVLIESNQTDKQIVVRLLRSGTDQLKSLGFPKSQGFGQDGLARIEIQDNGVGIPAENMDRIFLHGFTTREKGYGFGLHSAALATKEMRGTLTAYSDGPGTGATFVLQLPLKTTEVTPCAIETA